MYPRNSCQLVIVLCGMVRAKRRKRRLELISWRSFYFWTLSRVPHDDGQQPSSHAFERSEGPTLVCWVSYSSQKPLGRHVKNMIASYIQSIDSCTLSKTLCALFKRKKISQPDDSNHPKSGSRVCECWFFVLSVGFHNNSPELIMTSSCRSLVLQFHKNRG